MKAKPKRDIGLLMAWSKKGYACPWGWGISKEHVVRAMAATSWDRKDYTIHRVRITTIPLGRPRRGKKAK